MDNLGGSKQPALTYPERRPWRMIAIIGLAMARARDVSCRSGMRSDHHVVLIALPAIASHR
jgi:hypothetical protein